MIDDDEEAEIILSVDEKHRIAMARKRGQIDGKTALLQTWEECDQPDAEYITALRRRLSRLIAQFEVMKP
jgi:hypothetical protein